MHGLHACFSSALSDRQISHRIVDVVWLNDLCWNICGSGFNECAGVCRCYLGWQVPWSPEGSGVTSDGPGPWLRLFQNARTWLVQRQS